MRLQPRRLLPKGTEEALEALLQALPSRLLGFSALKTHNFQEVTALCEGGYALPARPDDGEFTWKVFEKAVESSEGGSTIQKVS